MIRHNNKFKIHKGEVYNELKEEWRYYANLTGFYDEICSKYKEGCFIYLYDKLNLTRY